jgi:hypothetical protein
LYNLLSKRKKRKKTKTTSYNLIAIYHDAPDHEKKRYGRAFKDTMKGYVRVPGDITSVAKHHLFIGV